MPDEPTPATLEDLNDGWPFGEGPDNWGWLIEWQPATENQPAGPHMVCRWCGQSMTRLGRWRHTWARLKPQVAAHVLQVHQEHIVR